MLVAKWMAITGLPDHQYFMVRSDGSPLALIREEGTLDMQHANAGHAALIRTLRSTMEDFGMDSAVLSPEGPREPQQLPRRVCERPHLARRRRYYKPCGPWTQVGAEAHEQARKPQVGLSAIKGANAFNDANTNAARTGRGPCLRNARDYVTHDMAEKSKTKRHAKRAKH
eukprot:scaffold174784_cov28-Prasinocladus_malaysianus.AAC.1